MPAVSGSCSRLCTSTGVSAPLLVAALSRKKDVGGHEPLVLGGADRPEQL